MEAEYYFRQPTAKYDIGHTAIGVNLSYIYHTEQEARLSRSVWNSHGLHADDDRYSRRGNFGGSLDHNVFISQKAPTSMVQEKQSLRAQGLCVVVKSCKIVFRGDISFLDTFAVGSAAMQSVTDGRHYDDDSRSYWAEYNGLKITSMLLRGSRSMSFSSDRAPP